MFRPYKFILRPYNKTDPRVVYVSLHCGILNASKFCYRSVKYMSLYMLNLCDAEGHPQALQEDRSKGCLCFIALWDPKCFQVLLQKCKIH